MMIRLVALLLTISFNGASWGSPETLAPEVCVGGIKAGQQSLGDAVDLDPSEARRIGDLLSREECTQDALRAAIPFYVRCVGHGGNTCDLRLRKVFERLPFSEAEESLSLDFSNRPGGLPSVWLPPCVARGGARCLAALEDSAQHRRYSAYRLAELYRDGRGVDRDPHDAAKWFIACGDEPRDLNASGSCDAELLKLIVEGAFGSLDDVPPDYLMTVAERKTYDYPDGANQLTFAERALRADSSALMRDRAALVYLATARRSDKDTGTKHMERALELSRATDVIRLAAEIHIGIASRADASTTKAQLEKAFELDPRPETGRNASAMLYSRIVEANSPDPAIAALAREWFTRAPEDAEFVARLAYMTYFGIGGPANPPEGLRLFRKAQQLGDQTATNTLTSIEIMTGAIDTTADAATGTSCDSADNPTAAIEQHFTWTRMLTARRGLPPPMNSGVVSASLRRLGFADTNSALLLFARDWDEHCVWLIDDSGIAGFASVYAAPGQLREQQRLLTRALGIPSKPDQRAAARRKGSYRGLVLSDEGNSGDVHSASKALSALLLPGEIRDLIPNYDYIVVAPYGTISAIPFAMLADSSAKPYIDTTSFAIAANLLELSSDDTFGRTTTTTWQDYRRSSSTTNPTGHVDSYVVVGNPLSDDHRFPSIPGSAREAKAVAAILGSEALIGAEARKSAVLLGLDQARLVYFATHGEARGETVEAALDESFLLFADGTLTAREIQQLRLNAELAVLSACQTGLGFEHSGGTIGLARAFQLAGIPRVLMSLWSVDDDATEYLMTRFMKYRDELGDFRALRQAMQEAKETYKHPALWAGFSFFGVNLL